jgi:uncharacterized protein
MTDTNGNGNGAAPIDTAAAEAKESALKAILREFPSLAVAYSGGVDSAYLSDVAHEVLGARSQMVIADSPSLPRSEFAEATRLAAERGWKLVVISTQEFENEEYLKNDGRRCYFCKSELFRRMKEYSDANRVQVLAYGAMADDAFDPTRLGALAATEHKIVAPMQLAKLGKAEIRHLSRRRGLPTSEKASFACLSSRFPKGTRVTLEDIRKVEAAEEALRRHGFYQFRARHHGDVCRIEIGMDDFQKLLDVQVREDLVQSIRDAGYQHVALDLSGYRDVNMAMMAPAKG